MTYLYHNERWQLTNTFHGSDADPYERYIHHAAGVYGGGSSSYIDRVILIDRDTNLDGTFNVRLYPMQNFRADVIGMITDTGKQRGQTRYDPYGVPFGIAPGDVNGDGIWDGGDLSILASKYTASNYHVRYDENLDGTFTESDIAAFINLGHDGGRGVPSDMAFLMSYTGHVDDPDLEGAITFTRVDIMVNTLGISTSLLSSRIVSNTVMLYYPGFVINNTFDMHSAIAIDKPASQPYAISLDTGGLQPVDVDDGGGDKCCSLPLDQKCSGYDYCDICTESNPKSYETAPPLQHCRCGIEKNPSLPAPTPNGCGGYIVDRFVLKYGNLTLNKIFEPCCDQHDIGYATCGKSKSSTDEEFSICMRAGCEREFTSWYEVIWLRACRLQALAYWGAVDLLGGGPYCDAQEEFCQCSGTCVN